MLDLSVGDSRRATLDVAPYDETTTATLRVHSPTDPDATGTNIAVDGGVELVNGDGVAVKRFAAAAYPLHSGAWWVEAWTVTGPGATQPENRFFVQPNPTAGGPEWTPTRARVAAYVSGRPLVAQTDGSNKQLETWDETTYPTGAQVDRIIADAVRWVVNATGDLHVSLYESGTAVAVIRAAGWVELSYPKRLEQTGQNANSTAKILLEQAERDLKQLAARNVALTGVDPDDPGGEDGEHAVAPVWSFPDPSPVGDQLL